MPFVTRSSPEQRKYRASVIFADGDSKLSCPLRSCSEAEDWIDLMFARYGMDIVATDTFVDTVH